MPAPLVVLALAVAAQGLEWPRFRGPGGGGCSEAVDLPVRFDAETNLIWRTAVASGRSSPVLAAERVFLTGVDGSTLVTLCCERSTGALLWRREAPRERAAPHDPHNSPASATPAVDAETVVVFFSDFGLLAYDHGGAELWRKPLGPFETKHAYGKGTSPVLEDGRVLLALDQLTDSVLLCLDAATGAELWRAERPWAWESWTTPVVHAGEGGRQEVLQLGGFLVESYDFETGRRLRWCRGTYYEPIAGPTVEGGVAYMMGFGPPRGELVDDERLHGPDADGDGLQSFAEFPLGAVGGPRARILFTIADLDRNEGLDAAEREYLRAVYHHYRLLEGGARSIFALRLEGSGDVTGDGILWSTPTSSAPEVSLPLLYRGALHLVSDEGGVFTRLDPATGAEILHARIPAAQDRHFASPVGGDGKVYFVSLGGTVVVLDAERTSLEPLAVNELGETCYATPALAGGRIFLRTEAALYCFGKGDG